MKGPVKGRKRMAWLDERVWCHPKFTDLTDRAGWTWAKSVAYACGMATGGVLTPGQQKLMGADAKVRRELVDARLWDELEDGSVTIHDWKEHNGQRDAKRKADRDRLRDKRATVAEMSQRQSPRHERDSPGLTGDRVKDEVKALGLYAVREMP